MESPVEIRYAGVVIGRAQDVQGADGDSSFFLPVREPMPVGSVLHLRTGDRDVPARVVRAVESADPVASGMHVRLIDEAEEVATEWIPPPAPVAEKARPAAEAVKTAMAVIELPVPPAKPVLDEAKAPATEQTTFAFTPTASDHSTAEPVPPTAPPAESLAAAEVASEPVPSPAPLQAPADPLTITSDDQAAVPEAIPVPVASSMTGALENAAAAEAAPVSPTGNTSAAAPAEAAAPTEELPPARPISGPSGRRKTKRRK